MSLKRLDTLSSNIVNCIIYVQSPSLEYHIKMVLKERFKVHKDFIVGVETMKALENAKLDSYVAPLMCDKWLIHVDADKLSRKDLFKALDNNTNHGITIYWTKKFAVYKQLKDSNIVKKQSSYCPTFTFSRLSYGEILHLHREMVPPKRQIDQELIDYVAKNYNYDVQAVLELLTMLKSGSEFTTKREIIENIGVGGNSVSSLLIKILTSNPTTEKGKKQVLRSIIKLLDDLSITYKYSTIRSFMLNNIEGCIEMKQLQIAGVYKRLNREIPETYDIKRLSMLKRFERVILEEISLPQILNLKLCLLHYNSLNSEIALIQAISEYFANLPVKPEKEKQKK